MRTEITNPVITCDRPREMAIAKDILAKMDIDFMPRKNGDIEIYHAFTPEELSNLINKIEQEAEYNEAYITNRILSLTPTDLARVIDRMHEWAEEETDNIKTVADVIRVLSLPDFIEEAQDCEGATGEDYFKVVFGL